MSRIAAVFKSGRKVLVPYITAGFPEPAATVPILHALADAGADIIELGMPFSDPMADGPVIQKACERAIAHGTSLSQTLDMVRAFRADDSTTPLVLMGYMNPISRLGMDRFAASAADAGVDGVLIVDAPIEESDSVTELSAQGLDRILLVAPTTPPDRIARIAALASGFVYYVSFAGITGASHLASDDVNAALARLREHCGLPLAVGFGIKTPRDAATLTEADAVVIGSALISHLESSEEAPEEAAKAFLAPFRAALDQISKTRNIS